MAFYHAQAGGCCYCSDEDAWSSKGFFGQHGGPAMSKKCLGHDNEDEENTTASISVWVWRGDTEEPVIITPINKFTVWVAI